MRGGARPAAAGYFLGAGAGVAGFGPATGVTLGYWKM